MATAVNEIRTYFGRCRCCLEYGYLKNMWTVHNWEGDSEIYGEMITQCFAFTLKKPGCVDQDQICETCITRLRDACNFKFLVIKSQRLLMQEGVSEGDMLKIKLEEVKSEKSIDGDSSLADDTRDGLDKEIEIDMAEIEKLEEVGVLLKEDAEFEDVEYLDEEVGPDGIKSDSGDSKALSESEGSGPSKSKWPKKLPRSERNKRYLQYTEEDLRNSLDAIKTNKMSTLEAAKFFNVPRKTLAAKLRDEAENKYSDPTREERFQFLTEIKTILTYTNGTPYKSRMSRYCCAYCTEETFEEAEDLRDHTRRAHMDDRTKKVDLMLRPYWMNEIVKLDIENLLCVVCCTPLYNWNEMFQHLKDKHNVILDLAYRKVVPYTLGPELKCALCKQVFVNYMQLDGHMNSHYNNYVCGDCGDTFLTGPRLKSHMKIHMVGKYACRQCDKVFKLEHYRKKHEAVVHKMSLYYKCTFCPKKFGSEKERKSHVIETHADKVKVITCEHCGKTFNWRHYYMSHVRKAHSDKKHECGDCGMRFFQKCDMEGHIASKHTGEKNFQCHICDKKFSSRPALAMHLRAHQRRRDQGT